ncbi:MAG: DNA internalization-related competence protein ComEC/Rec2 [Candidatus Cloacimonetes bacterium]|nr:DNA internalization-related competence protein ComEC/Rec2 [Candidatus Cloacimonadota bacterium]
MELKISGNTGLEDRRYSVPAPLLIISLFWIAGILAGFYLPSNWHRAELLFYVIPLFALIALTFLLFQDQLVKLLLLLLLVFLLGYLRSNLLTLFPDNHISNLFQLKEKIVAETEISIVREPQKREYIYGTNYRIFGDLITLNNYPIRGKVILTFPANYLAGDPEDLIPGNIIRTIAELTPYRNSRGFSRIPQPFFTNRSSQAAQGRAKTLVYAEPVSAGIYGLGSGYRYRISQIRRYIKKRIESRIPTEHIPFIKAILLGDREEMGDMRERLAAGGMAHLIAISGIHLAIITLILLTFLKLIHIRRVPAGLIIIIFFVIYGELCNWSPSVSRATLMISLLIICGILQRKPSYNNILAASLLIITIISPREIFAIGLQLSFISVFVLINILPLFNHKLQTIFRNRSFYNTMGYRTCQLLLTTFLISIFLLPMTLYYFNQFSLNGLIGNLIGIPLLTIIIPLAMIIVFIPSVPLLQTVFQNSFTLIMSLFTGWSRFTSTLPLFFNFIPFSWIQLILTYILLGLFFFWLKKYGLIPPKDKDKNRAKMWLNKQNKLLFLFYPALMMLILLIIFISTTINRKDLLIITLFDVGHGDLFLIETPEKESVMIDTGPTAETGIHLRYAALPYLKQQGINRLDWLIITHQHSDHYGGLKYLSQNVKIDNLMITDYFQQDEIWQSLQLLIDSTRTNIHLVRDTTHIALENMKLKILHPDAQFVSSNPNEMSIVVKMAFHNFSLLFTGDIEFDAEMHLITYYPTYLESQFLKIPHHGSRTSSSPPFIKAVNPEFAFIPTALRSRFNIPHPITLETLNFLGDRLFISGREGTLQIKTDGITAEMKTLPKERKITVNF